jgi:NADH-quinone oxidoreductase subunit F
VLRHLLNGTQGTPLGDYELPAGEAILSAVAASGLRGRGGAAYPTAAKWQVARDTRATQKFVVANGDEGDPGAYVDRLLLQESPHAILAGMLACARVIGAATGIVFIRGEYPTAAQRMRAAIAEADAAGVLPDFEVRVVTGAGSYVAGEESALLRAIEGLRAEPSPKPPYPAERGLHGAPTIVQNVETLSIIPWVVAHRQASTTKAICLSGAVARTGVVEVPFGMSLGEVLARGGGGPRAGARWKMALVGGPMGRVVPAAAFDQTPLDYQRFPGLGHGGVVVLDAGVSAGALARHLYRFAASESCGSCTPCRVGCAQLASRRDAADLERLLDTLEMGSLCGFGQGVPRPLRDLLRHFPDEVFRAD